MKVLPSENLKNVFENKYVYLDNDFLGILSEDEELFQSVLSFCGSNLAVDPFTQIEFLRDIFIPKQIQAKEKFIFNDFFVPIITHQDIYKKLQKNALLLSKIYKHQMQKKKYIACKPSIVDLLLAARLMHYPNNSVLITGNKKDFPSCIFDSLGVINYEDNGGYMRSFTVIQFNKDLFETSLEELEKMEAEIRTKEVIEKKEKI